MQAHEKGWETVQEPDVADAIQKVFSSSNFLNKISTGMLLRNAEGVIIDCNSAAETILESPRHKLIGNSSTHLETDAINLDGTPCTFKGTLALDSLKSGENLSGVLIGVLVGDKARKWLSAKFWPSIVNGEIVGVVKAF
jgi:hypothetical protein